MASTIERRREIYNILIDKKSVEVNDLSKKFNVSTMTIRRDLALLEKQGIVVTNYGGACLSEGTAIEPSFSLKAGQMIDKKKVMGLEASKLIQDGESIIIDCGTTTMQLGKNLQGKRLTVITNSLIVGNILQGFPKIKFIMAPGVYDDKSVGFLGAVTVDFFRKFNVDKAFIGAQGFDLYRGATVPDELDAEVKKAIALSAKEKILMVGHEKVGASFFSKILDVKDFDYIITDDMVAQKVIDDIEQKGVKVLVAK